MDDLSVSLSFSDALNLCTFDDTFDPLIAWPLSEWTSPELVLIPSTDAKTQIPEAKATRHVHKRARATRTRKRRREPTVKQPRKRAKTEILNLQSQVAELESQVAQLKNTAASLSLTNEPDNWSLRAAEELHRLQEAQELNARFKTALMGEVQVRGAFETELQTMSQLHAEMVELLGDIDSATEPDLQVIKRTSSLSQIRDILVDLGTLYSDTDLTVKEAEDERPREATTQRFELMDTERASWQHV